MGAARPHRPTADRLQRTAGFPLPLAPSSGPRRQLQSTTGASLLRAPASLPKPQLQQQKALHQGQTPAVLQPLPPKPALTAQASLMLRTPLARLPVLSSDVLLRSVRHPSQQQKCAWASRDGAAAATKQYIYNWHVLWCRMVLERDREALAEADAAEWEARHAVIEKQAEEARREKQRRRAQAEVERRSQVRLLL